jgi:hypothetical protein
MNLRENALDLEEGMSKKILVDEGRLCLTDDHAFIPQGTIDIVIKGGLEKADSKIDGIRAVNDDHVKVVRAVLDELQSIHGKNLDTAIRQPRTDTGEKLLRRTDDLLINIDEENLFNTTVLRNLPDAPAIPTADNEYSSRIRMRAQERMDHHFVIGELVRISEHQGTIKNQRSAILFRFDDKELLIGRFDVFQD